MSPRPKHAHIHGTQALMLIATHYRAKRKPFLASSNREELPRPAAQGLSHDRVGPVFSELRPQRAGSGYEGSVPGCGPYQQRYLGRDQVVPEYIHRVSAGQKLEAASWNHPKRRVAARGKRVTVPALSAALSHARKLLTSGQPAVPSGQIR